MLPSDTDKGEDVMNTPCPKCNQFSQHWVNVSDQLPEVGYMVVVQHDECGYISYGLAYYSGKNWYRWGMDSQWISSPVRWSLTPNLKPCKL